MEVTEESDFQLKFSTEFVLTELYLYGCGAHPKVKRNLLWLLHFTIGMLFLWVATILIINSMIRDLKVGDIAEACRQGSVAVLGFNTTFKYVILLLNQDDAKNMMDEMDHDYKVARSMPEFKRKIIKEYAVRGNFVTKVWFVVSTSAATSFVIIAGFSMISSLINGNFKRAMLFDFYVPYYNDVKYDNDYIYFLLNFVMAFYGYYVTLLLTGFDPFVPIYMLHCCGQLELVKINISRLYEENEDNRDRREKISEIASRLQHIYQNLDIVKSDFAGIYEIIYKSNIVLMPIAGHQFLECYRNDEPMLSYIVFVIACLVHVYVPCYYSDALMEKSLEISEELYGCAWESCPDTRTRRDIVIMMTRANRALSLSTVFTVVNLDLFAEMCRQSYTIFNLINTSMSRE